MALPPSRQRPRGSANQLHVAARDGSTERTVALLSIGVIDIDEGSDGSTPLMIATTFGHSQVVRVLLNKGANVSVVDGHGFTALHYAARDGHPTVIKLLVKAGADLEAKTSPKGCTPLILAAKENHSEVMRVLIEAGANLNSRALNGGTTSLFLAAQEGNVAATQVLVRAKANPLLTYTMPSGLTCVPLDVAAMAGHLEVAHELVQEYGIEGCGGASGGVHALRWAAENQRVETMGMLTSAGVVDTGSALIAAVTCGRESSVKFLLQQQEWKASGQRAGYLDTINTLGATPLVCSICSPRITRLLVDAGAATTMAVRLSRGGVAFFNDTPLALVDYYVRSKKIKGKDATEGQLHSLEGTRRLLMRVEAVHAASWLWARDAPSIAHAAAEGTGRAAETTPTPLISLLPTLRRRAGRPRVLLAALLRNSTKP